MIALSHRSAADFWRCAASGTARPCTWAPRALAVASSDGHAVRADLPVELSSLVKPIDVLVANKSDIRRSAFAVGRLWGAAVPHKALYGVSDRCLVSSPEFTFLQMAQQLDVLGLVQFGFELCGSYALDQDAESGFVARSPITDVESLRAFARLFPGRLGSAAALRACRFILDGSASPMETILAMLLCLPLAKGGYGIASPQLNHVISINRSACRVAHQAHLVCDCYWPDSKVAVEYDSDAFHTGAEKIYADSKRRMTLGYLGIEVITVTRKQVMLAAELERTARALAKATGKRIQRGEFEMTASRIELRKRLLARTDSAPRTVSGLRDWPIGEEPR